MSGERGRPDEPRRAELAESIERVRARIERACAAAGRSARSVRLLAVTKTFPASDAALLAELGLDQLAENRDQEAAPKAAEVAGLLPDTSVRWHMVGRLQRNKARSVARWADEVQTVDSHRLATALDKATRAERDTGRRYGPLDVLIQVSLDDDPSRGGCPPAELPALADWVAELGAVRLRGLMAVAPLNEQPGRAFARLAAAAERLRADHPDADELSAGMSADLDEAITYGSTCVRVGTALLGGRGLTSPL